MRYRKLDVNGDYTIGQGEANFWINEPGAVAQSIETRLRLWQGEWFLDTTDGTPWLQQVMGVRTGPTYDLAIRQRILETVGVSSIASYASTLSHDKRNLSVIGTVITVFSSDPVAFGVTL